MGVELMLKMVNRISCSWLMCVLMIRFVLLIVLEKFLCIFVWICLMFKKRVMERVRDRIVRNVVSLWFLRDERESCRIMMRFLSCGLVYG